MKRFLLIGMLLGLAAGPLGAVEYAAQLSEGGWSFRHDGEVCELRQSIPRYGEVRFSAERDRDLQLEVRPVHPLAAPGKGRMAMHPPVWRHDLSRRDLGVVPLLAGEVLTVLGRERALEVFYALETGHEVRLEHVGSAGEPVRVTLSPAGFRQVLADFRPCLDRPARLDFPVIRHWRVQFDFDEDRLRETARPTLERVLQRLRENPRTRLVLGGHADPQGERDYNRELSRGRAQSVRDWLAQRGIDPGRMEVRAFGESWPLEADSEEEASEEEVWARSRRVDLWWTLP
ncbi:Outer membrane protein OmpA [Ectothiorhodospira mobilis]|uniref:Outer membrane protein OmpA n=1 Tax=Ectothiorhodospira mobilis TaxID=195064 RepID=A0A1I4SBR7_ECTMO|nr:OmpA family protein [Ectothiorhodospira mobilis]SFM61905.1 Outer membrane protein OmpA [Ectothiorhodospira mobilis]